MEICRQYLTRQYLTRQYLTQKYLTVGLFHLCVVCGALVWGASPLAAEEEERPNLLLIVIDTLRADRLSVYGYERETSPAIDELAAEGVLYGKAISAAPWTLPAHASLFTGLYPRQHGTTSQSWTLPESIPTLAELLRDAGYRTGGFSNNVWTNDLTGLRRGFEEFFPLYEEQAVRSEGISFDDPDTDMGGKLTNETVLDWIDQGNDRPFFVFINYFEPHLPFRPPRPYDRTFLPQDASEADVRRLRSFYSPREYGYILRSPLARVSESDLEILSALYDAEVRYSDWILGELVEGLRRRGVLEDTVIAVTSDHGEHLGENHMLSHKLSIFDPLLVVPLLLWNPERLPAGVRVEAPVQAHDVFGTFLDFAGVEAADGAPRLPIPGADGTLGDDVAVRTHTFAELAYPEIFLKVAKKQVPGWPTKPFERALTTVRDGRWKLIVGSDGSVELYDLEADPREERNVAAENPEKVKELEAVLEGFRSGEI